ncbi:MAG TPA: ABC transporter ATP-binding protein [Actinobacteria bacterium]|nr:ABC transporter ATP-binding protein [Actinomycetota bacterium]
MNYAVEVKDLVKQFGQTVAVDGISFAIEKGKIFGFLGPNGAGKTTTINILCTLLKASSGNAYINGLESSQDPEKVRQSIGIVFQDPSLDERLTAWDNLEFHGLIYNLSKKLRRQRIDEVLDIVKLDDRRHDLVKTFSGGMKRRLEIARGLMHHPSVLFLDEPTLGLDPQTRNHIWSYIRKIKKEQNITIFLTTHYMEEAENCDDIAIIDHGKIIALDTPSNLKNSISKNKISLITEDNKKAADEIASKFDLEAIIIDGRIDVEVDDAEKFTPKLIKAIDVGIDVIQLRKPSLDDVFIELTGRTIRDEGLDAKDLLRERGRYRMRR